MLAPTKLLLLVKGMCSFFDVWDDNGRMHMSMRPFGEEYFAQAKRVSRHDNGGGNGISKKNGKRKAGKAEANRLSQRRKKIGA